MNRTLAAISILFILGGCCGKGKIWETDTFSLTADGIIQEGEGKEYRALEVKEVDMYGMDNI